MTPLARSCSGSAGEAEIDKLQAGEMTVTKLPVIVFDHPILKALEDMVGRKIDGIMGFTLFARFKTTIDYQANQMTFEPVNFEVRNLLKDLQDRMMAPRVARHKVLAPLGVWGSGWARRPAASTLRASRSRPSSPARPPRRGASRPAT